MKLHRPTDRELSAVTAGLLAAVAVAALTLALTNDPQGILPWWMHLAIILVTGFATTWVILRRRRQP